MIGLQLRGGLVRLEGFGQAIGLVVRLAELIVRGRAVGIEAHGALQWLDGFPPTCATAQRDAELQESIDVGLFFLQRHGAAWCEMVKRTLRPTRGWSLR